jgi:hypothetical protein
MRHGAGERDFFKSIRPPRSIASFIFSRGDDCGWFRIAGLAVASIGL